jgi:hypothetical protein
MTRSGLILPLTILAAVAWPACAASGHFAIRADSIVTAMNGLGMQVAPEQVTLLTDVVATTSAPRLKVRSMEKSGDHRMMVRLECENPEECLPFFVGLRLSQANDSQSVPSPSQLQSQSVSWARGYAKAPAIRSGSTATLLLDSDRVHIRLSVICLENGTAGQRIRVTSPDHRQYYMAEVIDGTLLKGSL